MTPRELFSATLRRLAPALAAAALPVATACINHDTVDGPVSPVSYDIVTFAGNLPTATFDLYAPGADTPARLTASQPLDTALAQPGHRVLLAYTAPAAGTDTIGFRGIGGVLSVPSSGARGVPPEWNCDSVWLVSIWRGGPYIDMRLRLPYSTEPRRFALAVDSTTLGTPRPVFYLAHKLPAGVEAAATFSRNYYASFNIAAVWNRPEVEGVEINVANANMPLKTKFSFNKPQQP